MAAKMPTYYVMALNAVACLPNRAGKGVSLPKIKDQIVDMYALEPINKKALSTALAKGVKEGDLEKVKASYKLSDAKKGAMPSKAKILTAAKNITEGPKPTKAAPKTEVKKTVGNRKKKAAGTGPKKSIVKTTARKKAAPKKKKATTTTVATSSNARTKKKRAAPKAKVVPATKKKAPAKRSTRTRK